VRRSTHVQVNERRLQTFLSLYLKILPLDVADVVAAGRIRADLETSKQPIGPFDTLIAGQALARNLTLITANVREFSRIKQLRWQDWALKR